VLGTPGDDPLRQRRTDARQTRDLAHVRMIQIYALPWQQRTGKLRGPSRCFSESAWPRD
jgi:hypothetical protein